MKGRAQWPLRIRHLVFVLLTALPAAAFLPSFVFASVANLPTDDRRFAAIGVSGSGPAPSRLSGRSAQIFVTDQKNRRRMLIAAAVAIEPRVDAPRAASVMPAPSLKAKFQHASAEPGILRPRRRL
jgi:hypothetical protein